MTGGTAFGFGAKAVAAAVAILCVLYGAADAAEHHNTSMYYVCPPKFLRLGSSCYYFSASMGTWQEAHFACKDRESNLTAPQRWEDRNLRNYLNQPEITQVERWIGGIYDWEAKSWKWGGEMRLMRYQSFSRMEKKNPEELKWNCIAMDPVILYRWTPRNCIDPKHYICQTPLRKVRRAERNRLRQHWKTMGIDEPNEITAPRMDDIDKNHLHNDDNEIVPYVQHAMTNRRPKPNVDINYNGGRNVDEYALNNVTPDPVVPTDPKFLPARRGKSVYAQRPSPQRRKPFRGYVRNRKNPEAAYRHNMEALRSGTTGLSNADIEKHMRRLERMRKREEMKRRNMVSKREEQRRQQSREHADKAFHDTTIDDKRRSRTDKSNNKMIPQLRSLTHRIRKGRRRGKDHSLENVTQRTITVDNALSASSELHPKVIVEIHDFKSNG